MSASSPSSAGPYAVIDTSSGQIVAELYPKSAPKTVANFVNLANAGFFNGLVWHRIVKGFVIQTGDPLTKNGGGDHSRWGTGGSEQTVPLEVSSLRNDTGTLGMARSQNPNSGSSQFYINLADNAFLNGQYTVFGKVISGQDAANKIGALPVDSMDQPIAHSNATVTSITIRNTP
jgi:dolichyl-diphosphooligosaccharide---protein glycosyltransferase